MRFALGILSLAALAASASASLQSYRVTGTFNYADSDFASLADTDFTFDFTYDTSAPNLGDAFTAAYEMNGAGLQTNLGSLEGIGVATIGLDPEFGILAFGAVQEVAPNNFITYGLVINDLPPQTGALPTDLPSLLNGSNATFAMVGGNGGLQSFTGVGTAFAERVSVQAVPEPASMAALAVGGIGLLRRRRKA